MTAPTAKPEPCRDCHGRGIFYGGGYVENGQYKGYSGPCFRCGGKGYQTADDKRRNFIYDTRYRRVSF